MRACVLIMYMVHMGINQRLDKAREKHPSWLGKPEEHIVLLLYGNGFDSVRACYRLGGFFPGLRCVHMAGLVCVSC